MRERVETAAADVPASEARTDEPDVTASDRLASRGAVRILTARWWLIVACVAVAMGTAAVYLRLARRIYTSTAMVAVEQSTPSVDPDHADHNLRFDSYLFTQAELLKTTPILTEVVKQPDVKDCRTLQGADDPVTVLQGLLDCTVGKKNDIISISLGSPYPEEAAGLLNHVVRAYLEYHSRNTRNTASEILKILKDAKEAEAVELSQAMAKVLEFRRAHGVLFLDNDKGNLITQRLAMLMDEVTRVELERIQAQVSHDAMLALRKEPVRLRELFRSLQPNAASTAEERTRLVETLNGSEVKRAGLLRNHAAAHPMVLEAAAECQAARDQLNKHDEQQLDAIIAVIEEQFRAAERREAELKAAMSKQRELAMEFNAKAVEYAMLESDLKRKEKLCDILDGRIQEIDIRGDAGGLNIAVLEWGKVSGKPSQPDRTRVLALALLLGVGLGIAFALTSEWVDDRIRKPADLPEAFRSCYLGEVGLLRDARRARLAPCRSRLGNQQLDVDEYDEIRAALCPPGLRAAGMTVLLTSPAEGDGKTSTVRGLANAIARTGVRTLVVDADFLDPGQHEAFGLPQAPGLSELLAGGATTADAIHATGRPCLDLLPSGATPMSVQQAIRDGACASLLEILALKYDCILVDSPPALASPDARALAAGCDKTVLVLRARQSVRATAVRARRALLQAKAMSVGVLLNALPS